MRCKTGPLLTVGAVLTALSLARLEPILELTKLLQQPSSKFVNWKRRMSFTSLPFLIHVSRQLDSAVTSGLEFAWFYARHFLLQQMPLQRSLREHKLLSEAEAAPVPRRVCMCARASFTF